MSTKLLKKPKKKYKYKCYSIYTKTLCKKLAGPFDYYFTAVDCMRNPKRYVKNESTNLINKENCVIRKIIHEWKE